MGCFDWDNFTANLVKGQVYLIEPIRNIIFLGHGWGPDVNLLEGEKYKAEFLRFDNHFSFSFWMKEPPDADGDCETFNFKEIHLYTSDEKQVNLDMNSVKSFHKELEEEHDRKAIENHEKEIKQLKRKHGWQ